MEHSAQHSLIGYGNCLIETLAAEEKDDNAQRIDRENAVAAY